MTYGTASAETMIALRGQGLESVTMIDSDSDIAARIDVVVYGALDESFDVTDIFHHESVVDAIADTLEARESLEGEWQVDAYHPNPDLCEELYSRKGEAY